MKKETKDYIKGFKHGVNWMLIFSNIESLDVDWDDEDFKEELKDTIKSLKAGK